MKLDNRTPYPTRLLRTIMCAVALDVRKKFGPLKKWQKPLIVIRPRDPKKLTHIREDGTPIGANDAHIPVRSYTGHAYLNGNRSVLSVPTTGLDVAKFTGLWRHELWHLYGVEHKDMPKAVMYPGTDRWAQMDPYVKQFGATIAPEVPASLVKTGKGEAISAKLKILAAREKRWQTARKRAETYLAKIRKQRRYYEKQFASASLSRAGMQGEGPAREPDVQAALVHGATRDPEPGLGNLPAGSV